MSYALRSSGLSTALLLCVAVDDDGTTIRDFKGNTNIIVNGAVTIGTSTWKGASRKYFETLPNGAFNFFGITWTNANGTLVNFADSDGAAIFCAFAGNSPGNPTRTWVSVQSDVQGLQVNSSGKATINFGGTSPATTTTIPTDGTTKFSVGGSHRGNNIAPQHAEIFYGAESGSLTSEGTSNPGEQGGNVPITGIGGPGGGNGNQAAKFFIVTVFNRELTESEMQSLHNDWFGTLFNADVTASGGIATVNTVAPSGSASAAVVATAGIATATTVAPSATASSVSANLSGQLINLSGAAVASVTGITVEIRKTVPTSATAPDKVFTNVSTDGSGNFGPLAISDIGLVNGQAVWAVFKKDGSPARGGNVKVIPTYS